MAPRHLMIHTAMKCSKEVAGFFRVHVRSPLALEGPVECGHVLHGPIAPTTGTTEQPAITDEKHLVGGILVAVNDEAQILIRVIAKGALVGVERDLDIRLAAILLLVELPLGFIGNPLLKPAVRGHHDPLRCTKKFGTRN